MAQGGHSRHQTMVDEGWDTTIIKAPDAPTHRKHKRHRKRKGSKVLIGVLVTILLIAGIGVGGGFLYLNSLNSAMSLGDDLDAVNEALGDAKAEDEPFYVLVMGVDMREGASADAVNASHPEYDSEEGHGSDGGVRSDTMMVIRVDTNTKAISILTIPRDTPYEKYEDGRIRGVNYAYTEGGAPGVIKAVSDITGLKLTHYAEISGSGLVELIDGLGGIDVNVPMAFDYTNITGTVVHLDEGVQHLDGDQALALAGMRVLYENPSDVIRQTNGRGVVTSIMKKVLSLPAAEIPGAISDAASCVKTNLSVAELADMASKLGSDVTIYTGAGPYGGTWNPYAEYDPPKEGYQWLQYVDTEGWERVIAAFTAGEDIGKVSYKGDAVHFAGQPKDTWSQGPKSPEELEAQANEEAAATEGEW